MFLYGKVGEWSFLIAEKKVPRFVKKRLEKKKKYKRSFEILILQTFFHF